MPGPLLDVENLSAIFQPDGDGNDETKDQPYRKQQNTGEAYDRKIEGAFVSVSTDGTFIAQRPSDPFHFIPAQRPLRLCLTHSRIILFMLNALQPLAVSQFENVPHPSGEGLG